MRSQGLQNEVKMSKTLGKRAEKREKGDENEKKCAQEHLVSLQA